MGGGGAGDIMHAYCPRGKCAQISATHRCSTLRTDSAGSSSKMHCSSKQQLLIKLKKRRHSNKQTGRDLGPLPLSFCVICEAKRQADEAKAQHQQMMSAKEAHVEKTEAGKLGQERLCSGIW